MSSFRSWLGGFLALILFFFARCFSGGYALPTFLALSFSVCYAWKFVLRIKDVPLEKSREAHTTCPGDDKAKAKRSPASPGSRPKPAAKPNPADCRKPAQGDPVFDDAAESAAAEDAAEKVLSGENQGEEDAEEEGDFDVEKSLERKNDGNELFKAGQYEEALEVYSGALELCPKKKKEHRKHRAALHSNKAACLQHLGLWEEVQRECTLAIENDAKYVKAIHRRCCAFERLEKWHDAATDLKRVLELDPAQKPKMASHLMMLERRAAEQFEKDKDEMIGKLKDLGNMVLGKFGMSVDNFQMEKDPNTGSYSMSYKSN
eukprot:gnl/MRDRNA2_/MRDRNA2_104629_c0_seq1.p1 gnl/MRDRNA2_/MRDRNA2_104629_c0~~gnl/MRDRNA2_/MRDRNA2_104629_c0_seq1.p1  ORF type:complete len:318 (-),score=79.43 gnl/MRDRNA2_/MRDRNA2_104629_c0_seq1:129-1082(-)